MLNSIIHTAVGYLNDAQSKSGGFISLSACSRLFNPAKVYLATFSTAIILNCMNQIGDSSTAPNPSVTAVKDLAAEFLLSQKNARWSFNYWARESPQTKTLPYPDDADDTFTALAALTQYNPELLDPAALAKITQLLISIEVEPGGPYRTWFVPPSAPEVWRDVDIAPNAAIAHFLQLRGIRLPKLLAYLDHLLSSGNIRSRYYPTEYPILYFLSRLDGLDHKDLIVRKLKSHLKSGEDINMMDAGLITSALANCRAPVADIQPAMDIILQQYSPNNWQPFAFCLDPAINGQTRYHGSGALSAAITLEALSKYENILAHKAILNTAVSSATKLSTESPKKSVANESVRQKVITLAQSACAQLKSPLREQTQAVLAKMLEQDRSHSIILLPQLFRQALGRHAASIKDGLIIQLGLAQLYGWCAFSTFDDVIDAQKPPADLPAAMLYLQWFFDSYHSIVADGIGKVGAAPEANHAAQALFKRYAQATTSAYAREVSTYRLPIHDNIMTLPDHLPNFQDDANWIDKSMGHALAPLVLLALLGHEETSAPMIATENFFRHYLAARQLHDDAHDWREDLSAGRLTPVTSLLLSAWQHRAGQTPQTHQSHRIGQNSFDLNLDLPKLHELFWNNLIETVSDDIRNHAAKARIALKAPSGHDALNQNALNIAESHQNFLDQPELLTNLLSGLEQGADKAITERDNIKTFMRAFNPKT